MSKYLTKEYATLEDAEEKLGIDYVLESTAVLGEERPGKPVKDPSIINNFIKTFKTLMSSRLKKQLTDSIFVQTLRCRGWWYEVVQVY